MTAGKRGSKERKWEGKAVQEKERMPGKANCLLLFLLFFTFPKLHKLSSKYLLTECDLYKVGYSPLGIQRICNSTKRWLNQTQSILTLCEFQQFCFFVTTHFRANTVFPFQRTCKQHFSQQRLTHCPIQSLFPNICSKVSWQLEMFY